ncbi:recombinase family protein [Candidatus Tisiphia endosymbiont of Nedyus quadrimaculatus]|uniref:recombinase family protein n=1 Tax=Candidatus Tisiphia endosymbiont of Nedyus quadrimaculatus TaxID=3139332 RepID=UPI00345E3725
MTSIFSEDERQNTDLQDDALIRAKVDQRSNIFKDQASGAKIKRTGLEEALNFLIKGDCLY